jgi:Nucleoside H+ symporter
VMDGMQDVVVEYAQLRIFGVVGSLLGAFAVFGLLSLAKQPEQGVAWLLKVSTGVSCLMVGLVLSRPMALGKKKSTKPLFPRLLGFEVAKSLLEKSFLQISVACMLLSIPMAFAGYAAYGFLSETGWTNYVGLGVALFLLSQAGALYALAPCLHSLGVKKSMLLVLALGYGVFAMGATSFGFLVFVGWLLQGVGSILVLITAQIWMEQSTPHGFRSTVQMTWVQVTSGIGLLVGVWVAQNVLNAYETKPGHQWSVLWYVPLAMIVLVAIGFGFFFRNDPKESVSA